MFKPTLLSMALASALIATPSIAMETRSNQFWWPDQLNLAPLRDHGPQSNPYGEDFDYIAAFEALDLNAVKRDINQVLTTSQPWWPADYGNYGPFFIRMAWHAAGTYRIADGRGGAGGGQQRFDPLNSWPDNGNLDKARRLLWPVKQKYGPAISWGDLMALTGNVALENMGFKTFGFAGGRQDDWEPDLVYWGPEQEMLADERRDEKGNLKEGLAAVQMGLIYVNPEGPGGNPDPIAAAKDIRISFGQMAMNDEEIVALIAGGHTFGKAHGAHKPEDCLGDAPAGAPTEQQGLGWKNRCGEGSGKDAITTGLEGAWTVTPTQWSTNFLDNLFNYNWVLTESPAGAKQWIPDEASAKYLVPDAHDPTKRHAPIMFTTDLAVKEDPQFRAIAENFRANPDAFERAFAKAWFKLNHRDLGPRARYIGNEIPEEVLLWQDPVPKASGPMITPQQQEQLKAAILASGLSVPELVKTAWASAASYRDTDMRGGANGARIALQPQSDWAVNNPSSLQTALQALTKVQQDFNQDSDGANVSLADVIVLGGNAALEKAAEQAGYALDVPFTPGRTDATQAMTDVASFAVLEPTADAFRNYYDPARNYRSPTEMMVERADLLDLTVPEMTVLMGGMRALNANSDGSSNGVLTDQPGTLSNDFFVNLLDMATRWSPAENQPGIYVGYDRASGEKKWTATPVDLIFGSNAELRAIAEVYAVNNAEQKFLDDFASAWNKVMNNDRFDVN